MTRARGQKNILLEQSLQRSFHDTPLLCFKMEEVLTRLPRSWVALEARSVGALVTQEIEHEGPSEAAFSVSMVLCSLDVCNTMIIVSRFEIQFQVLWCSNHSTIMCCHVSVVFAQLKTLFLANVSCVFVFIPSCKCLPLNDALF